MGRIVQMRLVEHHTHWRPLAWLLFGVFGGPAAWIGQLVLNYALAAYPCYPDHVALRSLPSNWQADRAWLFAINILALLVALAAGLVSARGLRLAGEGSQAADRELGIGEGPMRFIAGCGVLTGFGFLAAIAFNTVALIGAPQCSG